MGGVIRIVIAATMAVSLAGAGILQQDQTPSQLRLSWTGDPRNTMTVMWQTRKEAGSVVEFGQTEALGKAADGKTVSYAYQTGVIHEATLTGLRPDTQYWYRAGSVEGGFSAPASFRTAPNGVRDFTFTALGDHGTTPDSRANVWHMLADRPAFQLLLGDYSYANGNQPIWDEWFTLIEPFTRSIPMMAALGNHENERIEGNRIGYVSALARTAMPEPETRYFFDYCGVRFVAYNSDDRQNPEQREWLEKTLRDAREKDKVRWLIVFKHHPLYSSNVNRLDNQELISELREMLDKYKVDLVLAGHNHNYERSYPLRGAEPVSTDPTGSNKSAGVVFVVSGGGGKSLYKLTPEKPVKTAYRESMPHYLRVKVPARGPLAVEAVRTKDRTIADRFEIRP